MSGSVGTRVELRRCVALTLLLAAFMLCGSAHFCEAAEGVGTDAQLQELADAVNEADPDGPRQVSVIVDVANSKKRGTKEEEPYLATFDVTDLVPWNDLLSKAMQGLVYSTDASGAGDMEEVTDARYQDEQEALAESAAAGVQAAEDHQDMLQKKQQLPGILAGSTGGVQIPTQLAKIPSKKPIADEFVDRGCVSWRQTGNCDPYGMQEPDSDQDCDTLVASGWSGFCECADGKKVSHVDCAHETFTCAFRCARELAEDFFPPDFSEDDLTPAGISAKLQALTVFQELTPQNVHFYAHHNQKAFYLVLLSDGPGDTHMATVMEDLEKKIIANDQMQSVAWLWMKAVNQKLFRLDNVFLTANKKPSIVIDNIPNGANVEKYVFPKTNAMDADNAYAFFTDFEAGRGKLLVRSAIPKPLPSPMWNTDKVLDLVGVNFRDVVLTPGKTVLVMIYIPSCGGSQAVMPLMVQLAQHMKDNEDVIIARFDHSQSDFPVAGIKLAHYPTIFMWTKHKKGDGASEAEVFRSAYNFDDYNGSKLPHNTQVAHSHYDVDHLIEFVNEDFKHMLAHEAGHLDQHAAEHAAAQAAQEEQERLQNEAQQNKDNAQESANGSEGEQKQDQQQQPEQQVDPANWYPDELDPEEPP